MITMQAPSQASDIEEAILLMPTDNPTEHIQQCYADGWVAVKHSACPSPTDFTMQLRVEYLRQDGRRKRVIYITSEAHSKGVDNALALLDAYRSILKNIRVFGWSAVKSVPIGPLK